jgi:hypothetical protein
MYLVELRPGKEELYRTADELAAAIRNGDVDMHSRIYHRATSKWISVTLHPQYKAIVADRPAPPPEPPLPALERSSWTFFNDSADSLAGANDPDDQPAKGKEPPSDDGHRWRRPLSLSGAGGLLFLGLQLASNGPRPPWSSSGSEETSEASVRPVSAPASPASSPTISLAGNHASWSGAAQSWVTISGAGAPATAIDSAASSPAPKPLPRAPRVRPGTLLKDALAQPAETEGRGVRGMLARWAAAHDSAAARLESGVRVARLSQLLSAGRLTPDGGVTETRMGLAGFANFVRVYREQQAVIEREYQDSFTVASRSQHWSPGEIREWYTKPSRAEPRELVALTSSFLSAMDSLLGVIDAQAGAYQVDGDVIRFEDASAARSYSALRQRVMTTVAAAQRGGGEDTPGPMRYLLQAIGTSRLPRAS